MKDRYAMVEGWIDLGNLEEADLEFQKLPSRAISTRRGLALWLRLSLEMERWHEAEEAANQLRSVMPKEAYPVLCEAEALHRQGRTKQAVILMASHAANFTGGDWPGYLELLNGYVRLAELDPQQQAMFEAIIETVELAKPLPQCAVAVDQQVANDVVVWLRSREKSFERRVAE